MKFIVSISGYGASGAQGVTLECVHDKRDDVLIIVSETSFQESRPEGFALITNLPLMTRDFLFTDEHLRDAIRSYFARTGQDLIELMERVRRYTPDNKIENDGIDERGPKYRLSPDIGNGEMAVLAAVAFAHGQGSIDAAMTSMQDFTKLYTAFEV